MAAPVVFSAHGIGRNVSPHPLHLLLPQLGTEEDFAALRELLRYCDFTNEGICRRLGIPSIVDFQPKCDGRKTAIEMEQPIDAMLRLVLDGEFVPEICWMSCCRPGAVALMERLGILARVRHGQASYFPPSPCTRPRVPCCW